MKSNGDKKLTVLIKTFGCTFYLLWKQRIGTASSPNGVRYE